MCNQLSSDSISAATQISHFSGWPGWVWEKAGSGAERLFSTNRCQERGNAVTRCSSHFIYSQYLFSFGVLTNTGRFQTEREHVSHATMPYISRGNIWQFLIVKMSKNNIWSSFLCCLLLIVLPLPLVFPSSAIPVIRRVCRLKQKTRHFNTYWLTPIDHCCCLVKIRH